MSSRRTIASTPWALGAALAAMAGSAHAQGASQQAAADVAAPGEILVTAQRRSERLQDVPISIVARSGEQLEKSSVTGLRELTTVTPGLRFGTSGNALPVIRGVFSRLSDPQNDPAVSLYIDGIYMANVIANNIELVDVDRVEVLKGPQGTLFGRNATGGAIRIFTREPSFTPTGMVDVGYGRYDNFTAKGFLSFPIVDDRVALSISAAHEEADDYNRELVTGRHRKGLDSTSARAKLLVRATDDITANFIFGYGERFATSIYDYQPLNGNTASFNRPGVIVASRRNTYALTYIDVPDTQPKADSRIYMMGAKIDFDMEAGTLTSSTGYTDVRYTAVSQNQYSNAFNDIAQLNARGKDFTQELTFASRDFGMFKFLLGGFYYHGRGGYYPLRLIFSPTTVFFNWSQQTVEAYAGFGEVEFKPMERLTITGGLRYSHEDRVGRGIGYAPTPTTQPDPIPLLDPTMPKLRAHSFTPRVSIRYTLPSEDNIFFTYSEGFKSGGYNLGGLGRSPFQPEKLRTYEIGLKTSPRRLVSANLSGFYYKYSDMQQNAFVNGTNITTNASSAELYGFEIDVAARPLPVLTVSANAAYLHTRFEDFRNAVFNVPRTATAAGVPCTLCGNMTMTGDLTGRRLPEAPQWTFGLNGVYEETFDFGRVSLSSALYHSSSYGLEVSGRVRQSPYTTLSARVEFEPNDWNVTFYAWGKNLTNDHYFVSGFISAGGDGVTYSQPISYGVGVRYAF